MTLVVILILGCSKHDCAELSWSEYNTVEDVWCNFKYNKEESKAHIGDTLKVCGWLHYTTSLNMNSPSASVLLTCCKELQYTHDGGKLYRNPYVTIYANVLNDTMFPENPYNTIIYVCGTITYDMDIDRLVLTKTEIKKD